MGKEQCRMVSKGDKCFKVCKDGKGGEIGKEVDMSNCEKE
jgi:hypothetical protein